MARKDTYLLTPQKERKRKKGMFTQFKCDDKQIIFLEARGLPGLCQASWL